MVMHGMMCGKLFALGDGLADHVKDRPEQVLGLFAYIPIICGNMALSNWMSSFRDSHFGLIKRYPIACNMTNMNILIWGILHRLFGLWNMDT